MLQSGGHNEKWPTNGQIGYITPTGSMAPKGWQQVTKSEMSHKRADWPHGSDFCPVKWCNFSSLRLNRAPFVEVKLYFSLLR